MFKHVKSKLSGSSIISLMFAFVVFPFGLQQTTPTPQPTPSPMPTHEHEAGQRFLHDDSLIVSNPDCTAYCWRGIILGETTWDEAIEILEAQPDLEDFRLDNNKETGEITAIFQEVDGEPCCLIYTNAISSPLGGIEQILLQFAPHYTIGQVIENLGEPVYVSVTAVDEKDGNFMLFYPELGLAIYSMVDLKRGGLLQEDTQIFAALYLSPSEMEKVIAGSELVAYDGYKTFDQYYFAQPVITAVPSNQ